MLTITNRLVLVCAAATTVLLPNTASAQAPTIKSLVASHGSIVAGDLTFSNFQAPALLPYYSYGSLANDGGDVAVTATTTSSGRTGLTMTAIDPATGKAKPWAIDAAPGGVGGKNGGGGTTFLGDVTRHITFDVTVTNPQSLLSSVDTSYGSGTFTVLGTARFPNFAGAENLTYYMEPGTNTPYLMINDQYWSNTNLKSSSLGGYGTVPNGGSPLPGGYLRSFRFGSQMMLTVGPWGGIRAGQCTVDAYSITFSTVPANTPPVPVTTELSNFFVSSVGGGSSASGVVTLTAPAGDGGAEVLLASSDATVLSVPASVIVPQGAQNVYFSGATGQVTANATATATATRNGISKTASVIVYPAPPLALSWVAVPSTQFFNGALPSIAGGTSAPALVTMTTTVLGAAVTVQLTSSNPALQVPSSVVVPVGASSAAFTVTSSAVSAPTSVTVTGTYNGVSYAAATTLTPTATITAAEYWTVSRKFNITAKSSVANAVLTFGIDVNGPALGTMALSQNILTGKASMNTAPAVGVVWSSAGGVVTAPVTLLNK